MTPGRSPEARSKESDFAPARERRSAREESGPCTRDTTLESRAEPRSRSHWSSSTPKSAIALCLALSLTSCASIVSKSDWPVIVDSNPTGAALKITDESGMVVQTGTAPLALTLTAKQAFFCKADYDVEAQFTGQPATHARMSAALNPSTSATSSSAA